MYDISLIVLIYNQTIEKVQLTLNSILVQRNVTIEIIISDDCSKNDITSDIECFLKEKKFLHYKLIRNTNNLGTVVNALEAVKLAGGDVIKLISPGDFLSGENVLAEWLSFQKRVKAPIVFGDTIYYSLDSKNIKVLKRVAMPQNVKDYEKNVSIEKKIINYYGFHDQIHGASMMVGKEVLLKYLQILYEIKVIYCEDFFVYLAILEDVSINYFPKTVVWYEFGEGISNSGDTSWSRKIYEDMDMFNTYIKSLKIKNEKINELKNILTSSSMSTLGKIVFFMRNIHLMSYVISYKIHMKFNMRKTVIPNDLSWFYKMIDR